NHGGDETGDDRSRQPAGTRHLPNGRLASPHPVRGRCHLFPPAASGGPRANDPSLPSSVVLRPVRRGALRAFATASGGPSTGASERRSPARRSVWLASGGQDAGVSSVGRPRYIAPKSTAKVSASATGMASTSPTASRSDPMPTISATTHGITISGKT